jgi:membrane protein DedA with SNARE-associated domain
MLSSLVDTTLDFVRAHQEWSIPIVFMLAFCESIALVSLLIPATIILWGVGALIGASGMEFWPLWLAAAIGAMLGDWLSYWLGYHYHEPISRSWPLNRNPDLIPRAHRLFERYGVLAVFFGRFFGPLRAIVPLVAGATTMPQVPFQLANISSALAWAALVLAPGTLGAELIEGILN